MFTKIRSINEVVSTPSYIQPESLLQADKSAVRSLNNSLHSDAVSINPDNLVSLAISKKVADINRMYDRVFSPDLPLYNGHSGRVECHINMGPVKPPQRKGRLPHYDRKRMILLQEHFD